MYIHVPWKKVISIGATAALAATTTVVQQVQQKKLIEQIGAQIGQEVIKNTQKK